MKSKIVRLLDPSYGLYLHWLWEKQNKGSLLDHFLCGLHAVIMIYVVGLGLSYVLRSLGIVGFIGALAYGLGFIVRAHKEVKE